jgi:hypothetical protein
MKKMFRSYMAFTRTERMGLVCLSALLIILLLIRLTMHLWVHPSIDAEKQKRLVAEWEAFKQANREKDTVRQAQPKDSIVRVQTIKESAVTDTVPMRRIIRFKDGTAGE